MDWPPNVTNFSKREVACRHCGRENMALETILKFQFARNILHRPIYGTSWCRCATWNSEVGGVPDSSHKITDVKQCRAGDVTLAPLDDDGNASRNMTSHERYLLLDALQRVGFTRFGVHKKFIHTDDDPEKPPNVLWLY